jgi:Leucine-rich repeat (LRR) protein
VKLHEKYKGLSAFSWISEDGRQASIEYIPQTGPEESFLAVLADYPRLDNLWLTNIPISGKFSDSLAELSDLSSLTLKYGYSGNVSGIGKLRQLKNLSMDGHILSDLSVLEQLTELESLRLSHTYMNYGDGPAVTNVKDVNPLKHLPKLRDLEISFAGKDLCDFSEFKQLRSLSLFFVNGAGDLTPLKELTQLEKFSIRQEKRWSWGNGGIEPIPNLEPFAGFINLTELNIIGNEVRSLEGIKGMTMLKRLECSRNRIRTLKPLEKLLDLEILHAADNSIRNVTAMQGLIKLNEVKLGGNPIKDFSPIRGLPKYKPGWEDY